MTCFAQEIEAFARKVGGICALLLLCSLTPPFASAQQIFCEQRLSADPFQVVVPASIEGRGASIILDTGSYYNMLDPSLQSLLRQPFGTREVIGVNGPVTKTLYASPKITVGTWRTPFWCTGVADCDEFRRELGSDIRGSLGYGPLRQTAIEFDFDKRRLRFLSGFAARNPAMPFLPLEKSNADAPVPQIAVTIEGINADMVIDTGSNQCIGLKHEIFGELVAAGVIAPFQKSDVRGEVIYGSTRGSNGVFTRGHLLGIDLTDMPVQENRGVNNLAMKFLVNFNFVLDLAGGGFYYDKRSVAPPIREHAMLGAAFLFQEGHCRIIALLPGGGPAYYSGMRVGDEILKLGALTQKELNAQTIYELCAEHAGELIDVEFSRTGEMAGIKSRIKLSDKLFVYPPRR